MEDLSTSGASRPEQGATHKHEQAYCLQRIFTAIPKFSGKLLSEESIRDELNIDGVIVLFDPLKRNQWACFSSQGYNTFQEKLPHLPWSDWEWRKLGLDGTDPGESDRFQKAFVEGNHHLRVKQLEEALASDAYIPQTLQSSPSPSHNLSPVLSSHPIDENFSGESEPLRKADGDRPDPPEASSSSSSQQVRRVKRRIEPDTTETSTAGTVLEHSVGTPQALTKLPAEIFIMIFDLVLASSCDTARNYNARLEKLRHVCRWWRDVIDDAPIFWLRITSQCPFRFNSTAIQKSKRTKQLGSPFTVEFVPRSLKARATEEEFSKFMKLVGPYRSQWKSLNVILPSGRLGPLIRCTTAAAHHLRSLVLSMRAENPAEQAISSNVYKNLNLMGGAASRLNSVVLENIPVHYDPKLFFNLHQLELSGVQISPDELIAFMKNASLLQIFKLSDVFSTEPFQSSSQDRIVLQSLEHLTLQELSNPTNLSNFLLTLHAPNCRYLHIELIQNFEGEQEDLNLALNQLGTHISAIVQKTLDSELMVASHIRLGAEDDRCEWWSEASHPDGPTVGFWVALRPATGDVIDPMAGSFAAAFCRLVKRVSDETGSHPPRIKVDLLDRLRGAESILPNVFDGLAIVELSLNVVDGFLGRLATFMTIAGSTARRFPGLATLHLINTQSVEEERRYGGKSKTLAEFIGHLGQSGYAPTEDDGGLTVVLHGRFEASDELWSAVVEREQFEGIFVDHTLGKVWAEDGRLLYLKEGSIVGGWEDPLKIRRPW